jgi:hypothetical protein
MSGLTTSYLCVQGWGEDNSGVTIGDVVSADSDTTVINAGAAASQNLGDYTTLEGSASAVSLSCDVDIDMVPNDSSLDGSYTIAVIGVRVKPLSRDIVVRCAMTIGSEVYQSAATVYGLEMERDKPVGTEGHELFGSGVANFVFHDLDASALGTTVNFEFTIDEAGDFGDKSLLIGSIFCGLQIPLSVDRNSVSMGFQIANDRATTRGGNSIDSNGVLLRSLGFQAKEMPLSVITGISDGYYSGDYVGANLMRAAISNCGQPMLLSMFPYPVTGEWSESSPDAAEITERNRSRRQNFFALYGLLDRQIDVNADQSFSDGEMLYLARLRFSERR